MSYMGTGDLSSGAGTFAAVFEVESSCALRWGETPTSDGQPQARAADSTPTQSSPEIVGADIARFLGDRQSGIPDSLPQARPDRHTQDSSKSFIGVFWVNPELDDPI